MCRYQAIRETKLKITKKVTKFVLNVVYNYNLLAIDQTWHRSLYPAILQTLAFLEFLFVKLSETFCFDEHWIKLLLFRINNFTFYMSSV